MIMLQANQLSYLCGERLLWRDLQFEVFPGQLLQVSGANGCGKTSLLRVMTGLAPASAGAVMWQGVSIAKQKEGYQRQLHYLGHQTAVKNELTVSENLRLNGHSMGKISYLSAIGQVGLTTHLNHLGSQLSQGQKQRVALARLLLSTARLWILDEPMAGLDAEMGDKLETIFTHHLQQGGMIVLTTHRPLISAVLAPHAVRLNLV